MDAQPNMMMPAPAAPDAETRGAAAFELDDEMENPAAETEAPELLIPSALFPKGCKEGDTYTVTGTVGKMGQKVAFTPTGAFKQGGSPAKEDSAKN